MAVCSCVPVLSLPGPCEAHIHLTPGTHGLATSDTRKTALHMSPRFHGLFCFLGAAWTTQA